MMTKEEKAQFEAMVSASQVIRTWTTVAVESGHPTCWMDDVDDIRKIACIGLGLKDAKL